MSVITVSNLHKFYGPLHAVRGISFAVEEGEVFSLLGPNGAGKTTTVETIIGLLRRDRGEVRVLGFDPEKRLACSQIPYWGSAPNSASLSSSYCFRDTFAL